MNRYGIVVLCIISAVVCFTGRVHSISAYDAYGLFEEVWEGSFGALLSYPHLTKDEYELIKKLYKEYGQAYQETVKTGVLPSQKFEHIAQSIGKLPVMVVTVGRSEFLVVRKEP